jgi:hypothetical protein
MGTESLKGLENEYYIFSQIKAKMAAKISRWHKIHLDT